MTSGAIAPDRDSHPTARVLHLLRWTLTSLAEEVLPVSHGWVLRTPSFPLVWSLNQLRLTSPVTPARAAEMADELQSDQSFRHVVLEDASAVHDDVRDLGDDWKVDREVLMSLEGLPDRDVDTSTVIELRTEQTLALMRRWAMEELPEISVEALIQLEEYNRREGELWNERCFGFLGDDGLPVAITKLRSDRATGWVEDVYTVPEARGRGFARTLVTYATQLSRSADHDLTFIVADDNDWPKLLYARIGFRPIARIALLHRNLPHET